MSSTSFSLKSLKCQELPKFGLKYRYRCKDLRQGVQKAEMNVRCGGVHTSNFLFFGNSSKNQFTVHTYIWRPETPPPTSDQFGNWQSLQMQRQDAGAKEILSDSIIIGICSYDGDFQKIPL